MTKAAELAKMGEVLTNSQIGGRRNIIINGAMQVAQRATSVSSSDGSNEGYGTVDRFSFRWNNSLSGVATLSQSTDTPEGFANSFKVDVTTANNSMGSSSTDWLYLYQAIEGHNLQQLAYGTSSAKKITISFYAKRVGTWGQSQNISVGLQTKDGTAEYINASVTTQTSWTRHIITFNPSTSATINDDSGSGMELYFSLAGSQSGTHTGSASTSWSTTRQDFDNQIGNLLSNTANEFFITGIQLEVGSQATPFEHRSFGEELALCQRYFYRWKTDGEAYSNLCIGGCTSTTKARGVAQFPQTMRSNASLSSSGTFRIVSMGSGNVGTSITVSINRGHTLQPYIQFERSGGSSLTAGQTAEMGANNDTDAVIDFSAEL